MYINYSTSSDGLLSIKIVVGTIGENLYYMLHNYYQLQ